MALKAAHQEMVLGKSASTISLTLEDHVDEFEEEMITKNQQARKKCLS